MSAFGDNDPRTDCYDAIRQAQETYGLTAAEAIAAWLEALAMFADETKKE